MLKWFRRVGLVAVALVFVASGAAKFLGAEALVTQFDRFGLPHWFMLVTGAIEIIAAAMLLLPAWKPRFLAASLLTLTMLCGAALHLRFDPPTAAIPATLLAIVTASFAAYAIRRRSASV